MKIGPLCLALITIFSLMGISEQASALRCQGKIIDNGNTKAEVREFCGEPTCTRRPGTVFVNKAGIYVPMDADEEWVYNSGPGNFVRFIRRLGNHIQTSRLFGACTIFFRMFFVEGVRM